MIERDALLQAQVSYCHFVSRDSDYINNLLPRVFPAVKFNEVRVSNSFIFTYFDLNKILTIVIFFQKEAGAAHISFVSWI